MKKTLNPFENAKRIANGAGGVSPAIIEEMQGEITDIKAQLEIFAEDYSTTEHKIGRKWIDGKDIYEMTINLGTKLNLTTETASNVIADIGIDTLITNSGAIYNSSTSKNNVPIKLSVNNGYIKAVGISSGTTELKTIVIYYTKAGA